MTTQKIIHLAWMAAALALGPAMGGCERRVVETTHTNSGPDGTTVHKETTVQHDDGSVTVNKETHTDKP